MAINRTKYHRVEFKETPNAPGKTVVSNLWVLSNSGQFLIGQTVPRLLMNKGYFIKNCVLCLN